MKNRQQLLILIPAVIFVWGMIFFKFFAARDKNLDGNSIIPNRETSSLLSSDTISFILLENYNDPFLAGKFAEATFQQPLEGQSTVDENINSSYDENQDQLWGHELNVFKARITYGGFFEGNRSEHKLGVFKVDGGSHLLSEGQFLNDIYVMALFPDSAKVTYKNKVIVFNK